MKQENRTLLFNQLVGWQLPQMSVKNMLILHPLFFWHSECPTLFKQMVATYNEDLTIISQVESNEQIINYS